MLNLSVTNSQSAPRILLPNHKPPFIPIGRKAFFCADTQTKFKSVKKYENVHAGRGSVGTIKAFKTSNEKTSTATTAVKAVVTVQKTVLGEVFSGLSHLGLDEIVDAIVSRGLDDIADVMGRTLIVQLVAAELDPETGREKPTVKAYARLKSNLGDEIKYESDLNVPADFGEVGAIIVENEHHKEMFLKNIVVNGLKLVSCNSWIHSKFDDKKPRIFFIDKSYLPSNTPSGLTRYRQKELQTLRGDGTGLRKTYGRIYDYDVYNDLGDPDKSADLKRPPLGGKEHPYPRRCRTGRERTKSEPFSESRSNDVPYVPRDEAFSEVKEAYFLGKAAYSEFQSFVSQLESSALDSERGFPNFTAIETLFNQGVELPEHKAAGSFIDLLRWLVTTITNAENKIDKFLRFETPKLFDRDRFSWFRDEEFARQTLAGENPCCIQLVTEWPLKSKLDPEVYGPAESAITDEEVETQIGGSMTVQEAVKQKKLFILDYHDVFLPYVNKVRKLKGTTFYGSRTLFYLMPSGMLKPLAIELTQPPMDGKPQRKEVFTPSSDATEVWLWRLAKAHVLAHDSGYHQLVSHWLNTHCCMEPYIIATNRQLSAIHPIYRLLHPHMRYTMEINAWARKSLINADGVIEMSFSPLKYSIEISSVAYDKLWQFDLQALPANLIHRGMAVEDPTAPHGLKLTIEDYPYANDGLLIWDAIKKWVTDYVTYYYPEENLVESDSELQAWWTEIKTVGHADKKDEPWWPVLATTNDLIEIITTIIWVASGQHAAVNFGQYDFSAYFPNRPTIARTNMPRKEDPSDNGKEEFMKRPEEFLLNCFPSQVQATSVMAILDVLSSHSPDEEYIGDEIQPYWKEDKYITALFEQFYGRLTEIEGIIDARNEDETLKNRSGAGLVPYQLLRPFSKHGVTGMGVPNSISI